jgi:hypothetical protein
MELSVSCGCGVFQDALTCLASSEIKLSSLKERDPGLGPEEEEGGEQQVG